MMSKKIGVFLLLLPTFVLLGCNHDSGDNGAGGNSTGNTASLRIQNQSVAPLVNVVWNAHSFSDGQAISTGSNSQINNVQEGSSFIFFILWASVVT
ncbi:MAG: hypothetical protein FWB78_03470 [Treponema sp.]|nr:hypothetical protein [Treponema sp.]